MGSINFFLYLGPCHKNSPNPRSFTLVSTIFLEGLNENWPHLGHFVVHWDFFLLILLSGLVLQFFHWGTRKINFQLCKAPFTLPNFFFHHCFLSVTELLVRFGLLFQAAVGSSSSFHYFQPDYGTFNSNSTDLLHHSKFSLLHSATMIKESMKSSSFIAQDPVPCYQWTGRKAFIHR